MWSLQAVPPAALISPTAPIAPVPLTAPAAPTAPAPTAPITTTATATAVEFLSRDVQQWHILQLP